MREFLKHGSLVFAGTLCTNILFYAAYALVQRALGLEGGGLFMALLATTQILALPGMVLGTVIAKRASDAAARNELGVFPELMRQITTAFGVIVAVTTAILAISVPLLSAYFHTSDHVAVILAAIAFCFFFPLAPQRAVFQGAGLFNIFVISNLVEGVAKAATGAALLATGGSIDVAFGGFAAATACAFVFNIAVARRFGKPRHCLEFDLNRVLRRIIDVVLPISGLTAITFSDVILVRHYLPHSSGEYGMVALVGRAIVTVTQFAPTVLMPKAAAAAAQGRGAERLLIAAGLATGLIVAPTLLIVHIFPGRILASLGGGAFAAGAPLMFPYACAMTALAASTILVTFLIGISRFGFALPVTAACLAEVIGIIVYHPSAAAVVTIVLFGHSAGLLCTLVSAGRALSTTKAVRINESALEGAQAVALKLTDV